MNIIVADRSSLSVSIESEAIATRDRLLESTALIARVTNADQNQDAVSKLAEINGLLKVIEDARKQTKEPFFEFGKMIDAKAKQIAEPLMVEKIRVGALLADFQQLQIAKARAEENARKAELSRIEAEREALVAKAQTIEAIAEIRESFAAMQSKVEVKSAPVVAAGQSVKEDWEITVTNIHDLYRAFPNAVKMEPRMSEIRSILARWDGKIPGVTAKRIASVSVRAATPQPMIEA